MRSSGRRRQPVLLPGIKMASSSKCHFPDVAGRSRRMREAKYPPKWSSKSLILSAADDSLALPQDPLRQPDEHRGSKQKLFWRGKD